MNWMIDLFALNDLLMIAGVVFLATLVQSLTGFGAALVAMPFLVAVLGLRVAVPLFALIFLIFEFVLIIHFRDSIRLDTVLRISIPAAFGIPLGIIGLRVVDERILLGALGFVVLCYSIYGLFNYRFPVLRSPYWAYGSGFLAGILGGAYNTSGPPVIIYADSQRWPMNEFKGNLQGFFLVSASVAVVSHGFAQNISSAILTNALLVFPAVLIGYWAGIRLEKKFNPDQFRKAVLFLLLVIGIRLIFFG